MQSAEQPDEAVRWGATPEDWVHLELITGLGDRLLPVVANPLPEMSPASKLTEANKGRVPSTYDGARRITGMLKWTELPAVAARSRIGSWMAEPDYGICIRTGGPDGLVAIDVDVDDPDRAAAVVTLTGDMLGVLPTRVRVNSARVLFLIRVDGEPLYKRVAYLAGDDKVEVLANGQQFVACGTHHKGQRYEWAGGLPDAIPMIEAGLFEDWWAKLNAEMAVGKPMVARSGPRQRGEDLDIEDPRARWLEEQGLVIGGDEGRQDIVCPFAAGHSMDSGPSATSYFPAGTGGYTEGRYKCMHASCEGRSVDEYDEALGYYEASRAAALVDISEVDVPVPPDKPGPSPRRAVLDPKDTMLMARAFVGSCFGEGRSARLVRWGECWYEHLGTHYAEIGREPMRERGWGFLDEALRPSKDGPVRFAPEAKHVTTMIDATIKVAGVVSSAAPSWIRGAKGPDPREIAALQDGLLHIPTRTLLEHGPGFFSLNALPYAWGNGNGHAPVWERFLDDIWGDDAEAIETLQEIFGYLLTPDTSMQKMFLLVGPKRSGKGTIGRVLAGLLGVANMAAPTVNSIAGEFGLQPLIGKLVAIISDAREPSRALAGQLVERLLMLSGEDMITLNRKNKEMWTGNLTARVVISTNEVPRFYDASGAIASRFITLATSDSFLGREDPGLTKKLLGELPAIFRWALDGRDRLMARGYFRQPDSGRDVLDELEEAGSPIGAFVADMCVLEVGAVTAFDDLFEAWKGWCAVRGHQPGSASSFGRKLSAGFPKLSTSRPRGEGDERFKAKGGIRLKTRNYARLDEMDEPA
jgi:P4 family phage/plasmid primase-like protien